MTTSYYCAICHKGTTETIAFANYKFGKKEIGLYGFCDEHYKKADEYNHLNSNEAIKKIIDDQNNLSIDKKLELINLHIHAPSSIQKHIKVLKLIYALARSYTQKYKYYWAFLFTRWSLSI